MAKRSEANFERALKIQCVGDSATVEHIPPKNQPTVRYYGLYLEQEPWNGGEDG